NFRPKYRPPSDCETPHTGRPPAVLPPNACQAPTLVIRLVSAWPGRATPIDSRATTNERMNVIAEAMLLPRQCGYKRPSLSVHNCDAKCRRCLSIGQFLIRTAW